MTGEVAAVAKAVADPVRLRILELLSREQLCTCHLQEELGAKQTLVSHHLRALREAGVVEAEPHGRYSYYRLVPGALDGLTGVLGAVADAARDLPARRGC